MCKKRVIWIVLLVLVLLAVVSNFAAAALKLMPVGARVNDGTAVWVVIAVEGNKAHMVRASSIGKYAYDAAESASVNTEYQVGGNPTWASSNLYQYLNASGNDWFVPQHSDDVAPTYASETGYKTLIKPELIYVLEDTVQTPNSWGQLPWNGSTDDLTGCTGSTQCQLVRGYTTTTKSGTKPTSVQYDFKIVGTAPYFSYDDGFHNNRSTYYAVPAGYTWGGESHKVGNYTWQYTLYYYYGTPLYKTVYVPYTSTIYHYYTEPVWASSAQTLDIKAGAVRTNTVTDYTVANQVHPILCVDASDVYTAAVAKGGVYDLIYNTPSTAPTMLKLVGAKDIASTECLAIASGSTDADGDSMTYVYEIQDADTGTWSKLGESAGGVLRYKVPAKEKLNYSIRVYARDDRNRCSTYFTHDPVSIANNSKPQAPLNVRVSSQRQGMSAKVMCDAAIDVDGDAVEYLWELEAPGTGLKQVLQLAETTMDFVVPTDADTFEIRVKAIDSHGLESDYSTTGVLEVQTNQAPTAPTFISITGRKVGKVGKATTTMCVDSDGDAVNYVWYKRIDGGEWGLQGITTAPRIAYTIPMGAEYELSVHTADMYGAESARLISNKAKILSAEYPEPPEFGARDGLTHNPELVLFEADDEDTNNDHIVYRIAQ